MRDRPFTSTRERHDDGWIVTGGGIPGDTPEGVEAGLMDVRTEVEAIQRLGLGLLAGAACGLERERLDKPSGLRTYIYSFVKEPHSS